MLCVWWDQKGVVYYELLKPGETVNTKRYQQQLIDLNRSLLKKTTRIPKDTRSFFSMTMLHHGKTCSGYVGSTQLRNSIPCGLLTRLLTRQAPSDYHFASMGHALAEQRFGSYKDVKKWLDEWFAAKVEDFYWRGIQVARKMGKMCN